ncbi:MAG TPA: DUF1330 domain-containing protein [Candidatus Baltobacteraceae bacterium]|nr:DUF1330 domain-containing protein [Candidatus Baltobacteraceae bacterium]
MREQMPAYVIVNVDTKHPQEYETYKAMAQKTVAQYGGRYLARGGEMKVMEGSWEPTRIVILEFPSYEKAHEWWHSVEYAPAKELRQRLSATDLLIVEGYAPPR